MMFPQRLDSTIAYDIAKAMMDGFNRHYQLFRTESSLAKLRFEEADWQGQQQAQRDRIEFYELRVKECVTRLEKEYRAEQQAMDIWQQVKLHYIGLLVNHHQPELAETFFNSVTCSILHRTYFHNDFIFLRPAVSTEYIENDEPEATPTYRAYYPTRENLTETLELIVRNFQIQREFEDLPRDVRSVIQAMSAALIEVKLRTNFQIRVLSSLFFRNKAAYVVGKVINGYVEVPFALPILHNKRHQLIIDTALFGSDDLLILFSFARAYFMVDMEVPSAYVQFLRSMMPTKPRAEIYNALGLAKQGKNLFYRDFLHHLKHSSDKFRIAPGIKGMVMLVFDLPSFPYVFKLIKDWYPPPKDTTRDKIKSKYRLVKQHDRVGRMAETLEYRLVAFPLERFEPELIAEIKKFAPSQLEISDRDDDGRTELIIKHLYIERRMVPLNIYLKEAFEAGATDPDNHSDSAVRAREQVEHAVIEYGNAIKDLVAANIFPGDMQWKNFGMTDYGKVVFYDYDEIEYLSDCNFRGVPKPPEGQEEKSGEVWFDVGPRDVFPETFGPYLLGNPLVRQVFLQHHADLLSPAFWLKYQQRIQDGQVIDIYPYERSRRFSRLRAALGLASNSGGLDSQTSACIAQGLGQ